MPSWRHSAAIGCAAVLHVVLVWSVVSQTPDGNAPPTSPRFLTARLFFDAVTWPGPGGDFYALYHAGLQARRGGSPHDRTTIDGDPPYYFRYIYSPLLAQTLGWCLTLLPPRGAYFLWLGATEACLWTWLVLLWRADAPLSSRTFAGVALLAGQPFILELHMGQFTFVAVALALFAARRWQTAWGAVLLSMAIVLKTFPLVVIPAFLGRGSRRLLIAGLASAGAVFLSSVLGPRGSGHVALGMVDTIGGPHPGAESLSQAIYTIAMAVSGAWLPAALPWLPAIVGALCVGMTGWIVLHRRESALLGACAMLMAFFLGFLHVWEHHYSAVLLIDLVALVEISRTAQGRSDPACRLLVVTAILFALPSPFALAGPSFSSWSVTWWVVLSASKGVPTALALAAILRTLGQDRAPVPQFVDA